MERVNEAVEVLVRFTQGKMKIVRFYWHGRVHDVIRTTIKIERKDGSREFWCFGIETKTMVGELAMEKASFNWKLVGVANA
jgi:hypothetical protein